MYMKQYSKAVDMFEQANAIQRHDATYLHLGKVSVPCLSTQLVAVGEHWTEEELLPRSPSSVLARCTRSKKTSKRR